MNSKSDQPPKVYSYIRYSTPEQSLGDSERRQLELARKFADKRGIGFEDSLRLTDRGLSGFSGAHRKKGALGRFLEDVEAGRIEKGSILVVENIDRLTRESPCDALKEIVFKLWERDVSLATLSPEVVYDQSSQNSGEFIGLIIYMQRAQDESLRKSERGKAARDHARKEARESGRTLTGRLPAWFDPEKSKHRGERVAIPKAVETINNIFKWKRDGLSIRKIESKLNQSSGWKRPSGWRDTYIKKILKNRAVIGEYQPHTKVDGKRVPTGDPIPDYYPVIVDPKLFSAVQSLMEKNRGTGGRQDKGKNLFSGLAKCAYCGGSMRFVDKGNDNWRYLVCDNAVRNFKCQRNPVNYLESEKLILSNLAKLDPSVVLPNENQQANEIDQFNRDIEATQFELTECDAKMENLVDQIAETKSKSIRNRYEQKLQDLEELKRELLKNEKVLTRSLASVSRSSKTIKRWRSDLESLLSAIHEDDSIELRMKLKSHVRKLVERIEVFSVATPKLCRSMIATLHHPVRDSLI
ncbi:hypothetical protein C2E31_10950 [Rhodopirellula baltica]|nr:hypothetical protein C2E31_10950 [Rhodopirellula baltica]